MRQAAMRQVSPQFFDPHGDPLPPRFARAQRALGPTFTAALARSGWRQLGPSGDLEDGPGNFSRRRYVKAR